MTKYYEKVSVVYTDQTKEKVRLSQATKNVILIKHDENCTRLHSYVHDRTKQQPLPAVQPLNYTVFIPPNEVVPTSHAEMAARKRMIERSCQIHGTYKSLLREYSNDRYNQDALYEELRKLQALVVSDKPIKYIEKRFPLPSSGEQLRNIFFIEKFKFATCLPLKTGTTHWQQLLISLLYVDDKGKPHLDPENVVDENIFRELPRYSNQYNSEVFQPFGIDWEKVPCIHEYFRKVTKSQKYTRWMNTRHPMARFLSAWNQKFRISKGYDMMFYFGDDIRQIQKYEKADFDEKSGFKVSLEAFITYLSRVADDKQFNEHWKRLVL